MSENRRKHKHFYILKSKAYVLIIVLALLSGAMGAFIYTVIVPRQQIQEIPSVTYPEPTITPQVIIQKNEVQESSIKNNTLNISTFLRYGVCGDSLASGEAAHDETGDVHYTDLYDYSWIQYIARKTGNTAVNFSGSGMTTRSWLTDQRGLTKLKDPANICDCYFIALGENDANKLGVDYLGTFLDVDKENPLQSSDTFYGNYAKIIGHIRQVQPKAIIFCITRPNPDNNENIKSFNTAIEDVSKKMNCCLIKLTSEDFNATKENKRWGHYNAWGYNQWAEIIMDHVNDYMTKYPDKFRQIEFIGTDYLWSKY